LSVVRASLLAVENARRELGLVEWSPRERARIEEVAVNDMLVVEGRRKKEAGQGRSKNLSGSSRMSITEENS